jgi:hypothetical protein
MVGMRGFEPPVSASRTQRSTSLSHIPIEEMLSSQDDFGWQGLFLFSIVLSEFCFFTKKGEYTNIYELWMILRVHSL